MGISTSPSSVGSWWWWWSATFLVLIGVVLLVSPITIRPPFPEPVFTVDRTLLGLLILGAAAVMVVVVGPYADWRRRLGRPLGLAATLGVLALAVVALLGGADILATGFIGAGALVAVAGWFLNFDVVYRPPKDPKEREKEGWKCHSVGAGGTQCEKVNKDGTKEVWICDRGFNECVETPNV